jgi:hypothetical protein
MKINHDVMAVSLKGPSKSLASGPTGLYTVTVVCHSLKTVSQSLDSALAEIVSTGRLEQIPLEMLGTLFRHQSVLAMECSATGIDKQVLSSPSRASLLWHEVDSTFRPLSCAKQAPSISIAKDEWILRRTSFLAFRRVGGGSEALSLCAASHETS